MTPLPPQIRLPAETGTQGAGEPAGVQLVVRAFLLLAACLLLAGCAGALGGGASYRVDYPLPDGRVVGVRVDTVQSADSVDVSFSIDPDTGRVAATFRKTAVHPGTWSNAVVRGLIDKLPAP